VSDQTPEAVIGEMNEPGPALDGCPVQHGKKLVRPVHGDANSEWWPNRLNLKILAKNPAETNPLDPDFNYAEAFKALTSMRSRPTSPRCSPPRRTGGPPTSATTAR